MTGARIKKQNTQNKGFTLMEMLIVLGIFSVVLTMAADIFLMSNRTQRKTLSMEKIQSDARYTIEAMVREIRSGAIDYPWYENNLPLGGGDFSETLAIVDSQGDKIRFFKSQNESECDMPDTQSCILVSLNNGTPQVMTPAGVNVFRLAFYIRPLGDPYNFNNITGLFDSSGQPRVTISLVSESTATDVREQAVLYLQTTVGTRNFRR